MPEYRRVTPHKLHEAIDEADRLIIRESPMPESLLLFDSRDRGDLEGLKKVFALLEFPQPGVFLHCMCTGEEQILLYSKGQETVQLTNHHGTSVRCNLWGSDARIVHQEKWLAWLTQHRS